MPHFWTFIYLPAERVAVRKCVLSVEDQPISDMLCNSPWCQRVQRHFPPSQDLRCFKTVSSIILLTAHWYPGMIVKKHAVLSTPSLSLWQLVQTSVEVLSCAATCINTIWGYSNTDINVLMPKIYTYCVALKTPLRNIFMTPRRMWMMPTLTYALWSSKLQRTASRTAGEAPSYLAGTRNTRYTPLPRPTNRKLKKSNQLLDVLDQKRRTRWKEMSENNFTHSSRKAWSPINCLMGRISPPKPCPVMPVTPNPMPLLSLITVNGKTVAQRRKLTHIKSTLESKNWHLLFLKPVTSLPLSLSDPLRQRAEHQTVL